MVVSWSSGFIGYRYAADQSGVMLATFWRFVLAAVVLLPWGWSALRSMGGRAIAGQALVGVFAIAGFITPIAKAIEWGLAPGVTALIANLLPVAIVTLSLWTPERRTTRRQAGGFAICLAGMVIASFPDLQGQGSAYWLYLLPVLGVVSLAGSSLFQRTADAADVPAIGGLFIQICATLPIFAVLAWQEGALRPVATSGFITGVGWLVVFSTLGGYGFYWICLRRYSVQTVSAALFLTPLVTLIWASIQFGEALTAWAVAGLAITLAGVYVFAARPASRAHAKAASPQGEAASD
jgi:drug/metabolite transporter (DMT)-like permease